MLVHFQKPCRRLAVGTIRPLSTKVSSAVTTGRNTSSPPPLSNQPLSTSYVFVKAGLPMILFAVGATWVLQSAIEGKNKERQVAQGQISKSERQAKMEVEHDKMLQKISKVVTTDFDNTKRIERPEEVLERRRKERARRNVWYRRWGRWITGQKV